MKSERKLTGTIIGMGRMGITHYSILNCHPNVEFRAVCDASSFVMSYMRKTTAVRTYENYMKLLENECPDFAIVTTPTGLHAEVVGALVERGIHVFVEKPFAINPEQGQKILSLLETHDVVNQVGYVVRYSDVFMEVRRLIDCGVLGDPVSYKMEIYGPILLHDAQSGWRSKKREGGGCMYDLASHGVDLTNYLFGKPTMITGTVFKNVYSRDVEDSICSTLCYANGLCGNIMVCWSDASYRKPAYRFEVMGTKGKIIADMHNYKAFFMNDPGFEDFAKGWNKRYITDFAKPVRFYLRGYEFTRQLDSFIDCILDRSRPCLCPFSEGYATDTIINEMNATAIRIGY